MSFPRSLKAGASSVRDRGVQVTGPGNTVGTRFVYAGHSASRAKIGGSIFGHWADVQTVGTGEVDLYSDSILGNTLFANGETLQGFYGVTLVNSISTKRVRLYFGGTVIFDTGVLTISGSSEIAIYATIIRVDANTVRYSVMASTTGASTGSYSAVGQLGSLTLSNANTLKITGQAGGAGVATGDVTATLGNVAWYGAGSAGAESTASAD